MRWLELRIDLILATPLTISARSLNKVWMQDICNPCLTVQIDVEVMVLMLDLHSVRESLCFLRDIWWNLQHSPFLTNWTFGISLEQAFHSPYRISLSNFCCIANNELCIICFRILQGIREGLGDRFWGFSSKCF